MGRKNSEMLLKLILSTLLSTNLFLKVNTFKFAIWLSNFDFDVWELLLEQKLAEVLRQQEWVIDFIGVIQGIVLIFRMWKGSVFFPSTSQKVANSLSISW